MVRMLRGATVTTPTRRRGRGLPPHLQHDPTPRSDRDATTDGPVPQRLPGGPNTNTKRARSPATFLKRDSVDHPPPSRIRRDPTEHIRLIAKGSEIRQAIPTSASITAKSRSTRPGSWTERRSRVSAIAPPPFFPPRRTSPHPHRPQPQRSTARSGLIAHPRRSHHAIPAPIGGTALPPTSARSGAPA